MRSVFMRYPGGRAKAVTFSYDDGGMSDERLAKIFDTYGLKGTFNFNCEFCHAVNFTAEQIQRIFIEKGHEIAVHGAFHRANGNTRTIEGIRDVLDCRLELEKKCNRIVRGMAYPDTGIVTFGNFGTYEEVKHYLKELDIAYSRTLGGDNNSFLLPSDFYAWMPTTHHDNPQIMEWIDEFTGMDTSITKMYHARRTPRLFYVWGHSFEFDNNNNWEHIEEICKKISGKEDIWYATNIEICDYVQAYKQLRYSADGRMVYNPTVTEIWMDYDGKTVAVKPGETVIVE